jgi:anti-sigma regulatory factor (Ser/Thr protein kinase)
MRSPQLEQPFRHQALHYGSDEQFVREIELFLQQAAASGDPALVVVESHKLPMLRSRVDESVNLVAMDEVGRNPGRIISLWQDFLDLHKTSETVWGVGEPIFPGRSAAELIECQIHERLLNLAFAGAPIPFNLACPYDISSLSADVISESKVSHAFLGGQRSPAFHFNGGFMSGPLTPPPTDASIHLTARNDLSEMRDLITAKGREAGVAEQRLPDVVLAASEIAVNSILYSGGGEMLLWRETDRLLCEFRDKGTIEDPLVGRFRPGPRERRGRGIWLAHQLADLVQLRSGPGGTVIRLSFNAST